MEDETEGAIDKGSENCNYKNPVPGAVVNPDIECEQRAHLPWWTDLSFESTDLYDPLVCRVTWNWETEVGTQNFKLLK